MSLKRNIMLMVGSAIVALSPSPSHAAVLATGDIFAGIANGLVAHYSSTGAFIENLNTGQGGFTTGMAFDNPGNLYVTNFSAGNITRFAQGTGAIIAPNPFVSPGSAPESIAFNASGDFYVGRAGGQFQKYSAGGSLLQTYSTPVNSDWLDLAANQTTMFYNDEGGQIRRWDLTTDTALADFANTSIGGGTSSYALRILSNGDVLSAAGSRVVQFDSAGSFLGFYDVGGVDGFFALNLDPSGTSFLSGSFSNNTLYRFTLGNFGTDLQTQTIVTSGQLFGVAIAGEQTVGNPNPGVPEPATWAMMIGGLGLVGATMRRAKAVVRFA